MSKVNKNPKGLHTITPGIAVHDAKGAIEFYKKAFGAVEVDVCLGADKRVMHAEIKIGDSMVMLSDEFPEMNVLSAKTLGGSPITFYLQVEDVDMWIDRAVKAGAELQMPAADRFWGDRTGRVGDPYGLRWGVSTHVKDVTPEEMEKAMKEWEKKEAACAN